MVIDVKLHNKWITPIVQNLTIDKFSCSTLEFIGDIVKQMGLN